jgi:hypothetical protein
MDSVFESDRVAVGAQNPRPSARLSHSIKMLVY